MKCKNLICHRPRMPGSPYCSYECAPCTRLNKDPTKKVYPMLTYKSGMNGRQYRKQKEAKADQTGMIVALKEALATDDEAAKS